MERLGRITTSLPDLPDLPIDRRMTYGAMRRAIVGLPVTVSSASCRTDYGAATTHPTA